MNREDLAGPDGQPLLVTHGRCKVEFEWRGGATASTRENKATVSLLWVSKVSFNIMSSARKLFFPDLWSRARTAHIPLHSLTILNTSSLLDAFALLLSECRALGWRQPRIKGRFVTKRLAICSQEQQVQPVNDGESQAAELENLRHDWRRPIQDAVSALPLGAAEAQKQSAMTLLLCLNRFLRCLYFTWVHLFLTTFYCYSLHLYSNICFLLLTLKIKHDHYTCV